MAKNDSLLFSAYVNGVGVATVLPQLCRRPASQGLLTATDVEVLRHSALLGFDMLREHREFSKEEIENLEEIRERADSLWHRAAEAVRPTGQA